MRMCLGLEERLESRGKFVFVVQEVNAVSGLVQKV